MKQNNGMVVGFEEKSGNLLLCLLEYFVCKVLPTFFQPRI
jgi:hypothetical protein